MTIAIIKTGGKQYKVTEGQELKVEKLVEAVGQTIKFDAMLVSDEAGENVEVGTPLVAGKSVEAEVVEHGQGDKVTTVKFKAKTRYRRTIGHRQPFTKIKITSIK
jgi:large subunit ribosomal protein L21